MHTLHDTLKGTVLAAALASASGCGTTYQDRGLGGAGIGAGAGAIVGALTGLTVVEAAAFGALGGALTGLLTDASQINLGDPAWKRSPEATAVREVVADMQVKLAARGYDPGPADGVVGAQTRAAIRAYQRDRNMLVDGQVTPELLRSLDS